MENEYINASGRNINPKYKCKCGCSHITFVGDLGKYGDEQGNDRMIECGCGCEFWNGDKRIKAG